MLICVRTTLHIEDGLMRLLREKARQSEKTLTQAVEEAVRSYVTAEVVQAEAIQLPISRCRGGTQPGVDLEWISYDRDFGLIITASYA